MRCKKPAAQHKLPALRHQYGRVKIRPHRVDEAEGLAVLMDEDW